MNVWSGAISLDGGVHLRGLQLIDRSSNWQSDFASDSTLSLRSFVNPALIPLYARCGPNLEFHTSDAEAAQWLKDKLTGTIWLEEDEPDRLQTLQCPVGLLLGVGNDGQATVPGSHTTDLLVHGILSTTTSIERPPTPPVSSPELENQLAPVTRQELKIYATPLSASLIAKAQSLPFPPDSDEPTGHGQFAQFLPDMRSPSPKRKRVATLFESVAQHHKRVRQRGGEAVSQLMACSLSQSSQQLQSLRVKRESEEPSLPQLDRIVSQRSRSLSVGTNFNANLLESRSEQTRPSSRRGYVREPTSKRSTPNPFIESSLRRETELSPSLPPDSKPESPATPQDAEVIISENKNTITRTILTCMRLYGFNRTTTRSSGSRPQTGTSNHDIVPGTGEDKDPRMAMADASNSEEDEFKTMYHATYRASTFALRKYLKEPSAGEDGSRNMPLLLEKGKAMTYIDEFLRLFCEEN
ncbi:hypothetical protein BO70DRAFT_336216 [Aspergillus heteromorphus CBS 117.55]|uniref:Sld7 C-terminal domain-containing protein n=1 Tax=Aspergillus heteromorphus CBS 117.55 TaxID=1448321 RepID=A0A317WFJ8_9EURO|nr:uncharacterized protein BO70DRAFT_336216 [Aspergillus heteromorphus CBS 117.55]PWY83020.1 hypothetical protein BO70DRAFT_336216 [Aspergillus heteromorphus CBS 117.55]